MFPLSKRPKPEASRVKRAAQVSWPERKGWLAGVHKEYSGVFSVGVRTVGLSFANLDQCKFVDCSFFTWPAKVLGLRITVLRKNLDIFREVKLVENASIKLSLPKFHKVRINQIQVYQSSTAVESSTHHFSPNSPPPTHQQTAPTLTMPPPEQPNRRLIVDMFTVLSLTTVLIFVLLIITVLGPAYFPDALRHALERLPGFPPELSDPDLLAAKFLKLGQAGYHLQSQLLRIPDWAGLFSPNGLQCRQETAS
ncbi:hypothetical protein B0T16DRAFT_403283 [Cercophora newfieldiana]|uniref:Uncharacterized protein n=1 Tax=Cercophora newfieldiana TaxID=92897 RepID=A0AA39YEI4_9PEZI|nr:hypothetical protein B0T16DRAFT_403283 [Cercophora newfieldiana]